jgi:hypothetical protein
MKNKSYNNIHTICVWFCLKRTVINSAIRKWTVPELPKKYRRNFPLVIPFVIDMMNSVHSLLTKLLMDYSVGNSVGKNGTSSFFLLCFNYFFSTIILSVNTKRIFPPVKSIGNLPTKIFPWYFRLYLSIFW